jgi:hypothetical protein
MLLSDDGTHDNDKGSTHHTAEVRYPSRWDVQVPALGIRPASTPFAYIGFNSWLAYANNFLFTDDHHCEKMIRK